MITVGYGDIVPITTNEMIFCMFAMLLASGVFAFTMNSIGSVIQSFEAGKAVYK